MGFAGSGLFGDSLSSGHIPLQGFRFGISTENVLKEPLRKNARGIRGTPWSNLGANSLSASRIPSEETLAVVDPEVLSAHMVVDYEDAVGG